MQQQHATVCCEHAHSHEEAEAPGNDRALDAGASSEVAVAALVPSITIRSDSQLYPTNRHSFVPQIPTATLIRPFHQQLHRGHAQVHPTRRNGSLKSNTPVQDTSTAAGALSKAAKCIEAQTAKLHRSGRP